MVSLERQGLLDESESMEISDNPENFSTRNNGNLMNQHCHSLLLERKEVIFLIFFNY